MRRVGRFGIDDTGQVVLATRGDSGTIAQYERLAVESDEVLRGAPGTEECRRAEPRPVTRPARPNRRLFPGE